MTDQRELFPEAADAVPAPARLVRIRPARNERRFYRLQITADLFEGWCLLREWGRLGSPGRLCRDLFMSLAEATAAMAALLRAKTRRGYSIVLE